MKRPAAYGCRTTEASLDSSVVGFVDGNSCVSDGRRRAFFEVSLPPDLSFTVSVTPIDQSTLEDAQLDLFASGPVGVDPPSVRGGPTQTIRYTTPPFYFLKWEIEVSYGAASSGRFGLALQRYLLPFRNFPGACVAQSLACNQTFSGFFGPDTCTLDGPGRKRYIPFEIDLDANRSASAVLTTHTLDPEIYAYRRGVFSIENLIYEARGIADTSPAVASIPPGASRSLDWFLASTVQETGSAGYSLTSICSCFLPTITQQPAAAKAGVSISVSAAGDQPLHYAWYVGATGDTSRPLEQDSATLILSNLMPTQIWVRVSNPCGHVDSETAAVPIPSAPGRLHGARR